MTHVTSLILHSFDNVLFTQHHALAQTDLPSKNNTFDLNVVGFRLSSVALVCFMAMDVVLFCLMVPPL